MPLNSKVYLTCAQCGRTSSPAGRAGEARDLAAGEGWLTARIGSKLVPGWEEDYCPSCAPDHPRFYCAGTPVGKETNDGPAGTCNRKAVVMFSREGVDVKVYACGSHAWILQKEMLQARNGKVICELPPS